MFLNLGIPQELHLGILTTFLEFLNFFKIFTILAQKVAVRSVKDLQRPAVTLHVHLQICQVNTMTPSVLSRIFTPSEFRVALQQVLGTSK